MIKNVNGQVQSWPIQKDQLSDLILAPDGRIYLSPSFEETADWSFVYYNGSSCAHWCDNIYCRGGLPKKCMSFPVSVGETSFQNVEDAGYLLRSCEPVLDDDTSVFAVFRFKDQLAIYMADSTVSRGIYFILMDYTPKDEALQIEVFIRLLSRHDTGMAENLTTWLNCHFAFGKEV